MMDPLEAGERVVNGVRNNDLYILTHPEFRPGMQQKFDAIMASIPPETAPLAARAGGTAMVYCNIFPLELAHRNQPRQSYRGLNACRTKLPPRMKHRRAAASSWKAWRWAPAPGFPVRHVHGGAAQNAPPAPPTGAAAGAVRNPPPVSLTVSQPAPLKDVKGKVAYITAASDGIGLGIARACSNAGMKVVIGYRNEARLAEALPLFKPGNAGVYSSSMTLPTATPGSARWQTSTASSATCICWSTMPAPSP